MKRVLPVIHKTFVFISVNSVSDTFIKALNLAFYINIASIFLLCYRVALLKCNILLNSYDMNSLIRRVNTKGIILKCSGEYLSQKMSYI